MVSNTEIPHIELSAKILAERTVGNVWLKEFINQHSVNPPAK